MTFHTSSCQSDGVTLVGVALVPSEQLGNGLLPKTHTMTITKIFDLPYPIYELTQKI